MRFKLDISAKQVHSELKIIDKDALTTVKLQNFKRLPNRTELNTSSSRRNALELFDYFCIFFERSSVRSNRTSK
jgi:hypothetical protein